MRNLTNYLISEGVTKGERVGIGLERSTEMVACIIGILKSGAAYVPFDSSYPKDRWEIMKEDARLSLLITHKSSLNKLGDDLSSVAIWENITKDIVQCSDVIPPVQIDGEDVAYVIFTSGSTGRPKGIEMPHRALSNLIEWQLGRDYFKKQAKVIQYSSISFDVSFQEIVSTFASGGTLFLVEDDKRRDPRILLNLITDLKIERLFIPFVALRSLVEVATATDSLPGTLREVITAGEQLRVDVKMREFFSQLPGSILENQYGPSETHVIAAHLLEANPSNWPDLPPIGKPIKNNRIFILDEDKMPVDQGEPGELYLAGQNLSHGYLGRADLTKKSFFKNLHNFPNQILYKSGDVGLCNEDGEIKFVGRVDHQIKIRGYRVEPGEINTVGADYPGIAQCLTHADKASDGKTRLITYYVAQKDRKVDEAGLKIYLSKMLPEYMVPTFIVELKTIPHTPSGKVDFKSLPEPEKQIPGAEEKVTYKTETEAWLAEIWHNLLGYDDIPRSANFFDLGGDSLSAVTLFIRIEERFEKKLPLSILTQAPTIKELSQFIDDENEEIDFSRFSSLQLIQHGSEDKPPLFLVHGGDGNVLTFRDLTKGLPADQPIYAFQWPGWGGHEGKDDILEMAKLYKDELREACPHGPYRLGGFCIGGIIALEIAKLLKVEGAKVLDPVLVADAPNLHSKHFRPNGLVSSSKKKDVLDQLRSRLEAEIPASSSVRESAKRNNQEKKKNYSARRYPLLAKYLPYYLQLGKTYLKLKRWTIRTIKGIRIWLRSKLSLPIPLWDRQRYCQLRQITAVKQHAKTIYENDVLYLKSKDLDGGRILIKGWWDDIFWGFEELCSGKFKNYVIESRHNDIFRKDRTHQIISKRMLNIN